MTRYLKYAAGALVGASSYNNLIFYRSSTGNDRIEDVYPEVSDARSENKGITTDQNGSYPAFYVPDEWNEVWVATYPGDTNRVRLLPSSYFTTEQKSEQNGTFVQVTEAPASVKRDGTVAGNGVTDDGAALNAAIAAGARYVPPGTYNTSVPIVASSLILDPRATIRATATMAAVVRTGIATSANDGGITGKGKIDGQQLADIGIHPRYFARFEINGLNIDNCLVSGIKLGDTGAAGRSAEANVINCHIQRTTASSSPAGGRGIQFENSGDHSLSKLIVSGFETGCYFPAGGNAMVDDVHVWTPPANGATKISFEDRSNNSHYVNCHADTPTQYGWRVYGYQPTLVSCGTYLNPSDSNATDNVVVGIQFEGTNSIATVLGHFFLGGAANKRLAADIVATDGNYDLINIVPLTGQHTVTTNAFRGRVVGLDVRDYVSTRQQFRVNPTAPTNETGLTIQTNGVDRWKWCTDGAAESGSNAGTGLALRSYSDAGALLNEILYIVRTGTVTLKKSLVIQDGNNIVAGSTTGTQIATNSAQKLGFFGVTPVVRPTAPTAADASTVDSTYGAEEAAVLANVRTRLNEVVTKLQALGLLT